VLRVRRYADDRVMPIANAEFLHERQPDSRLAIIDAGHFVWDEARAEYASIGRRFMTLNAVTTHHSGAMRGDTREANLGNCPFAGTSHAGGGTRTPDTRIMIPLL
jgi:hypothetical protein